MPAAGLTRDAKESGIQDIVGKVYSPGGGHDGKGGGAETAGSYLLLGGGASGRNPNSLYINELHA